MTRLRLRKLARDVWLARTRMVMMTVAIAVSVLAVGAFLSAQSILRREMSANYLGTRPASATLRVPGGVDRATLDAVRGRPGILDATVRGSVLARIRVSDGAWRALLLFVSDPADPQRISTVQPARGAWPPPADGLLLERTALPFLGIRPGDAVVVQVPGGPPRRLTVTGSVHDAGVAPAEQERTAYGYVTTATSPGTLTDLKIVVGDRAGPSGDAGRITVAAQGIAAMLAARGVRVDHIEVPPPLRHPHQGQMVTVGLVLLAFGIMALLLSSILVATMLGGLLAGQIRQIGAMKAIGARTGQILVMYLLLTAGIATVATALAVLPAALLGRLLAGGGARLLNLDLTDRSVPAWVYAVQIGAGIGVPLLVAIGPLARGSRITVREAIDDHGIDGQAGLPRWLGRLWLPNRSASLALRNMFRRKARLTLTVGLLAVAGAMFLTGLNTAAGWGSLVDQGIAHRHYDIEVRLDKPAPAARLTEAVAGVPGVTGVQAWGRQPTAVAIPGRVDVAHVYPDDAHGSFTMLAPPADTPLVRLPLLAGRWLRPTDTDAVVLNNLAAPVIAGAVHVGGDIRLTVDGHPTTWHVVGIAADFGSQGTAYVTDRGYAQATGRPGEASLLRISTDRHDPAGRQATLDAVEKVLSANGIAVEQSLPIDELRAALDGHVIVLADVLIAIALVLGFVGLLGLASTMSTSVVERTREFGVLHVIGATTAAVRTIVVIEGVLIGAVSIVVATLACLPLTAALGDYMGALAFRQPLPFQFSIPALVLWTVVALGGAAAATTAAARRASRLTIREALVIL